ncbi:MAG: hypothetical protein ACRDL7_01350, partial [Gaiellaceae bacterium]
TVLAPFHYRIRRPCPQQQQMKDPLLSCPHSPFGQQRHTQLTQIFLLLSRDAGCINGFDTFC